MNVKKHNRILSIVIIVTAVLILLGSSLLLVLLGFLKIFTQAEIEGLVIVSFYITLILFPIFYLITGIMLFMERPNAGFYGIISGIWSIPVGAVFFVIKPIGIFPGVFIIALGIYSLWFFLSPKGKNFYEKSVITSRKKIIISVLGSVPIIFGLVVIAVSEYNRYMKDSAPLVVKQLPQKNPASYTFDGKIDRIRQKIIAGLESRDWDFPLKTVRGDMKPPAAFDVCTVGDEICLPVNDPEFEKIIKKPENKNDIYLINDGAGMISRTYFESDKPLDYLADFHIHLESVEAERTKITIIPLNTFVYKGTEGTGMHGGPLPKKVEVEPTTVEEYQLLRYIGSLLGEKDMPEVILPE